MTRRKRKTSQEHRGNSILRNWDLGCAKMIDKPFIFKINDGSGPNLLLQVFLERGWREYNEESMIKDDWNIWWRNGGFPLSQWKSLKSWQFTNHVPKASCICRKDYLCRYLKCMKNTFGAIFDFSPDAFILPLDYTKLVEQCSRSPYDRKSDVWICKPVGQSQGRGICIFRKVSDLVYANNSVVQRYVKNPLLIGGYKFDLRLYVCVPCFRPLTVYVYREGLARFSTDKFSLADLTNRYAHLTNCSLNKQGPGYLELKERVGAGCKWSLKQLRYYMEQNGHDDWLLWQRIATMIVLTITSQISGVPSVPNCFEFYGFDILIDSALKPWLLEVNISPALCTDCDVDPAVKKPMLHDMFDLLGLPVCNTGLCLFSEWCRSPEDSDSSLEDEYPAFRKTTKMAVNVVTMANKWKRQVKPQNAKERKGPGLSYSGSNQSKMESSRLKTGGKTPHQKPHTAGGISGMKRHSTPTCRANRNPWRSKDWPKCKWDNGRDWRQPPKSEGDWVRIYPYQKKEPESWEEQPEPQPFHTSDKEMRDIVSNVTKYYRLARDVYGKTLRFSDEERDNALLNVPDLLDAIWHPYK